MSSRITWSVSKLALVAAVALVGGPASADSYSPYADEKYPSRLLFGETHVHSALSADAGGGGTRLMPRDVYRFAAGEKLNSNTGQPVRLARPFDFFALTEHTDGMGAFTDLLRGAPAILADKQGSYFHKEFNAGGDRAKAASIELIRLFSQGELSPVLNYQPGNPGYEATWEDLVAAAEEFNRPGVFTTLIAYEWTSLVKGNNLHRNVFLRDGPERALQVLPLTMTPPQGSPDPRRLWQWLEEYEAKTGGDALAIPHNSNLSNGIMFALQNDFENGAQYTDEYLKTRAKWEPLVEIGQTKGDSETHPSLSPEDEFADYERWDWANLDRIQVIKGWVDDKGEPQEQVHDVAWSGDRKPGRDGKLPLVGDTVDLLVPTWSNTIGEAQLMTFWQDPDFDPDQQAFYYARVIEIPTPRWTAYDAIRLKAPIDDSVKLKTRERAYSSPIWYSPK